MLSSLKNFLFGQPANYAELLKQGAIVIDVRTSAEYAQGHITGSVNIPLDRVGSAASRYSKEQVIITCCASGMRSASARQTLHAKGFLNVHNGGGWAGLQSKLK
jgi:phage shock protein E